jgi:hypothetical protein
MDSSAHRPFTSDDWNHINPGGGRTRGREAVLKELREVHGTFLKGVTDTITSLDVRFATPDVAVATVTSQMSALHDARWGQARERGTHQGHLS